MHHRTCRTLVSTLLVFTSLTLGAQYAKAQFLFSNFTGGGYFAYGDFMSTQGPNYLDISSAEANGGIAFTSLPINLTAYAMNPLYITALTLPGNLQPGLQIYLYTEANPSYGYYYTIPGSDYNGVSLTTGYSATLNDPSFVLDASHGYSYVGSGTAFAPDLSVVTLLGIQGIAYGSAPLDYSFTGFGASNVPEPGTYALLGSVLLSGVAFLRRPRAR